MSKGQQLYELWQQYCGAGPDSWDVLIEEDQEDWETFAMNLSLDHGLRLE